MNRLPAAEPSVFTGDIISYMDWKASFMALIDTRCTSRTEKMHYLRQYIGGEVTNVVENSFLQNTVEAYEEAWVTLDRRYGDPFRAAQAFRDKLHSWPKLAPKDSQGLFKLADFLKSCRATRQYVVDLQSLDNCHENQQLLSKLPDWMTSRWNRQVFSILKTTECYPSFSAFVDFVAEEALIACNPISSLHALKTFDSVRPTEHRPVGQREVGRKRANVFCYRSNREDDGVATIRKGQTPSLFVL